MKSFLQTRSRLFKKQSTSGIEQDREDNRVMARQQLTMPVLMMGAQSGVGLSWLDTIQATAANVETALVPMSGHYLPEERPREVAQILSKFMSGRTSAA